ncbi:MAG: peptidylprolyl isomerase [Christensenellaceae bacterium]|jgi:peptidyl-prolyl cis-trans isomerase B (cyclophilin B)|nr:peptidylprolyl isomerase [Christensenellaceae bacterium]
MVNKQIRILIKLADRRQMRLILDPQSAPGTVENFMSLVDRGYYQGLCFHRIIPDFMVQAGGHKVIDKMIADAEEMPTIFGEFFSNDFNRNYIKHEKGVISMARSKEKDSASTQFFICTATSTHLDGHYAAFGRIADEESMETLMELNEAPTAVINALFTDFPYPPIVIESITRIDSSEVV